MEIIKSITEAFSQQPFKHEIVSEEIYPTYWNKVLAVKKIILETRRVDSDKECNFYVGYNYEGEKLFEYLQSSVNVNYEPTNI